MKRGTTARTWIGAASVCLAALGSRAADTRSATPARFRVKSFAEVMTPRTLFFLEIPDYSRARSAYRSTPRWKLWWEGAGRKLVSAWVKSEEDAEFTSSVRTFVESLKLPRGKVAFAFEMPRQGADADIDMEFPVPVFLAEAGSDAAALRRAIEAMAGPAFTGRQEGLVEGVRFVESDEFLVGGEAGIVIAGEGRAAVSDLIARFDRKPRQGLSADASFRAAKSRALENAHFLAFVNYAATWDLMRKEMEDEEVAALEKSGLTRLAALAWSGRFAPGGVTDRLSFIMHGKPRGVWTLLAPEPLTRRTWSVLPDFTSGFVSVRMDLARKVRPFREFLRSMDPEAEADFVEPFAEFRETTGFSVEKDVLPLAAGELTFVFLGEPADAAKPKAVDPDIPDIPKSWRLMLLAVELRDPPAARALMDGLTRPRGGEEALARGRRFGGLSGWQVGDEIDGHVYVAGTAGVGLLALAPEPIERVAAHLAARGRRLVDADEFRGATRWIPEDAGVAAYSNVSKVMKSLRKLTVAELEDMGVEAEVPAADDLLVNVTPLTAALRVEKPDRQPPAAAGPTFRPGFTVDVRSPDGFLAFYNQLAAHLAWRMEYETEEMPELSVGPPPRPGPTVLAVRREAGLVMVSVGSDQGVKAGADYEVLRGGTRVGRVRVTKAYSGMASAKIIEEAPGRTVRESDEVRPARSVPAAPAPARGAAPPARRGVKVVAVMGDGKRVMISGGTKDGIEKGATLVVCRGETRVARVRVEQAFGGMSAAGVIEKLGDEEVRAGDELRRE